MTQAGDVTVPGMKLWVHFPCVAAWSSIKPREYLTISGPQLTSTTWKATKAVWTHIPSFLGKFSLSVARCPENLQLQKTFFS